MEPVPSRGKEADAPVPVVTTRAPMAIPRRRGVNATKAAHAACGPSVRPEQVFAAIPNAGSPEIVTSAIVTARSLGFVIETGTVGD